MFQRKREATRPVTAYPNVPIRPEKQIRVLALLPGDLQKDIECELSVQDIASDGAELPCAALSYTWGSWQDYRTVVLDSQPGFPVTQNLWAALRRLRHPTESRKLWVDQICINQGRIPERNCQVRLMGQLYRQASEVIIWLGDTPERNLCQRTFDHVRSWGGRRYDDSILVLDRAFTEARSTWHTRAWVVQEVVTATREPTICFGSSQLPWVKVWNMWKDLTDSTFGFTHPPASICAFDDFLQHLGQIRPAAKKDELTLLDFAHLMAKTDCSNARDKVYSLLGLISDRERDVIKVDYARNTVDVYAEATYANIAASQSFAILGLVAPKTKHDWTGPSWTVDFRNLGNADFDNVRGWERHRFLKTFSLKPRKWLPSQSHSQLDHHFDGSTRNLTITGLRFDEITRYGYSTLSDLQSKLPVVGSTNLPDLDLQKLYDLTTSPYIGLSQPASANSSITMTIGDEMSWDFLRHHTSIWTRSFAPESSPGEYDFRDGVLVSETLGRWWLYLSYLDRNRSLKRTYVTSTVKYCAFVTRHGFFGFGPCNIAVGDLIVLPQGGCVPMLLRPVQGDRCNFVSLVYIHGIMHQELAEVVPDLNLKEEQFVLV